MTDKEQIIINGIDYTNALEDYLNDCIVDYCKSAHCDIEMAKDIILFPVAKQIEKLQQEKEKFKQECEELKERASIAEDNFACEVQARLYHQNEWLKFSKECEELKKQLKTSEKWRINAESLNEKLDINNTRYRKALEEIEKYCIKKLL